MGGRAILEIKPPELGGVLDVGPDAALDYGIVEHLRPLRLLRLDAPPDDVQVLKAVDEVVLESDLLDVLEIVDMCFLAQETVDLLHSRCRLAREIVVIDEVHAVLPSACRRVADRVVGVPSGLAKQLLDHPM